ncbi:MAG: 50S ribosomal protein L10 [Chitinivibrionales bacterium]|nr:50S ribosomal protein L10 [Chitinivibrionales bacterium]MBD3396191.1 50S ribosomal protein L10 [Chitinivibrionales bacterium]
MATTRTERLQAIEKLEKEFDQATGIYLTDFSGIDVEKMTKLRRELRGIGAKYIVVKNTLARIALEKCGKTDLVEHVKGPVGVAIATEDSIGPARVIKGFKKENKELLGVSVAYVDGSLYDDRQTAALADLPSRDVLLAQFLSCLQAPVTNFAGALNGILTKFVGTLEAVKNKREAEGQ